MGSLSAWLPDVIFIAVLLVGAVIGYIRGFVKGISKLAGTILSILCAVFFCMPLHNHLETWFGFTTLLNKSVGAPFGEWLSVAICFVGLLVLIKLLSWLVGCILKSVIKVSKAMNLIDRIFGALLGIAQALFLLFIILMICQWINVPQVNEFIGSSKLVGAIFTSGWFQQAILLPGRLLTGH